MISPHNIIITIEKRFVDELDFNGGKIYYDSSYNLEHNVIPSGTVVSVPVYNKYEPMVSPEFFHSVKAGDKLYFNYQVIMDEDNCFVHEGQEYWMVNYHMAICAVRDGKIIPAGEHILIEPHKEEVTHDLLIIPDLAKEKEVNYGKVIASNDEQIPQGATVYFEPQGMFENKIEGRTLYAMYNGNILGIYEDK